MTLKQADKDQICWLYDNKQYPTIQAMAKHAGVSTRTFNRVLVETGRVTKRLKAQDEARAYAKVLHYHGINTPAQLAKILQDFSTGQKNINFDDPVQMEEFTKKRVAFMKQLDKEQVQRYLNTCTVEELASLFYMSGLMKIAEIHKTSVMNGTLKHQQAAREAQGTSTVVAPMPAEPAHPKKSEQHASYPAYQR